MPVDLTKILLSVCCVLILEEVVGAQVSDLRYSRRPLPGVAEISHIGLVVNLGPAEDLISPSAIIEPVEARMRILGYHVVSGPMHPPDGLWLQVDCQGLPDKIRSDASRRLRSSSNDISRLPPPCHLTYRYQQEVIPWKTVDRLIYSESVKTMKQLATLPRVLKVQECVKEFFTSYDFPVLLAAEWGHGDRLLPVLQRPNTSISRQRLILTILGEIRMDEGYSILVRKLRDNRVAVEAAQALGYFGLRAQKHLLPLLQDHSNPLLQEASARGLGRIAATTGNSQQTPLYLKMVADSSVNIRVRTQLALALGKAPDMRAFPGLIRLEQEIWAEYSHDPELQAFRDAVDWSIREVKQGGHGDNF